MNIIFIFASVEESATEVTFTLEDEETTFTIKKYIPFKIGTDDGNGKGKSSTRQSANGFGEPGKTPTAPM